ADIEDWGFNRPEREITLTFADRATPALSGAGSIDPASRSGPIIVRLGTDAGRTLVYARVVTDPGKSVYTVNIDLARDLPVDPIAWRDRTLRDPLPQTARF